LYNLGMNKHGFIHTSTRLRRVKVVSSAPARTVIQTGGFTIVELIVVIVVIGILAAITIVSYTGISSRATASALQADLASAKKQLNLYYVDNSAYPTSLNANNCPVLSGVIDTRYCLKPSSGNTFTYSPVVVIGSNPQSFTLVAINTASTTKYTVTNNSSPVTFSSNWIAGIAATALANKWVYNVDVGGLSYKSSNDAVASPQGATGLDSNYSSNYVLVSPQSNASVDFSAYPAQNACKAIGGRLPIVEEILAIYSAQATYGNNYTAGGYWSSTESGTMTSYSSYFHSSGSLVAGNKTNAYYVRCVAG